MLKRLALFVVALFGLSVVVSQHCAFCLAMLASEDGRRQLAACRR